MKKQPYASFFPEKSDKKIIAALRPCVRRCEKALSFNPWAQSPSLQLSPDQRTQLAEILVDFVFDLHTKTGIWATLEKYNTELFGTPLPLIVPPNATLPDGLCVERVQFLLWNIFPQLTDYIISNRHKALIPLAEDITYVLECLPPLPDVSPVKDFLNTPNDYGWEVKKKLIWLGTKSYLFRLFFDEYFEDNYDGEEEASPIAVTDDFICQNTTLWSGLGVIDILAGCLNVPREQKDELRTWYLRHLSFYKIIKTGKEASEAVNLINGTPYQIREGAPSDPRTSYFRPKMTIRGGLVPWRGEWYWSGMQHDFTPYSEKDMAVVIHEFKLNTRVVARYWKERDEKVREFAAEYFRKIQDFYGKNLVLFPSDRDWHQAQKNWHAAYAKSLGQPGRVPDIPLPEELRGCKNGIGVFIDTLEGEEIMSDFNDVISGLKKNGDTCTPDECEMIRNWIDSLSISPAFVHRVLKEYGGEESIKYSFRWETDDSCWLDYMLRRHKGDFYRRRFPPLSVVDSE